MASAAISFAAGSAEVAALLASAPVWLDVDGPNDTALSPVETATQRGRYPSARLAWRWECTVRGPANSPFEGESYRVLVRLPLAYPSAPPKLHVLSTITHLEVEVRDPHEGNLDDSFYERLAERVESGSGGQAAAAPPAVRTVVPGRPSLRFGLGARVECKVGRSVHGDSGWVAGEVVALWYTEAEMRSAVPYQVLLNDGRLVMAPQDDDRLIRAERKNASGGCGGGGTYTVAGALELFVELLRGPLPNPSMEEEVQSPEEEEAALLQDLASDVEAQAEDGLATAMQAAANGGADGVGGGDGGEVSGEAGGEEAGGEEAGGEEGDGEEGDGEEEGGAFAGCSMERAVEEGSSGLSAAAKYRKAWTRVSARHEDDAILKRAYREQCLHPSLFAGTIDPSWLHPSFAKLVLGDEPPSKAAVIAFVDQMVPGIYAFDMLAPAFCEMLLEELNNYEASGLPVARPNTMNNYGVILNSIGMERTMDALQRVCVRPLAAALFPTEGEHVDHHHSFMVQYKQGEDLGLDMHTDACDVTVNVCLGKEFSGAGLTFCGLRGDVSGNERRFCYRHQHVKGRGIIHLGHQRHGADDIVTGERFNLIMWNKSSCYRTTRDFSSKYSHGVSSRGPPDLVCLSYTHDDDYEEFQPYPPGKRPKRERGG